MNGVIGQLMRSLKWRVPSRVSPLGALHEHRAADRVRQRRDAIEAGALRGDGEVLRSAEVPCARVVGLDLERLAGLDPEERLVAPVEGVLPRLLACDALHGQSPSGSRIATAAG